MFVANKNDANISTYPSKPSTINGFRPILSDKGPEKARKDNLPQPVQATAAKTVPVATANLAGSVKFACEIKFHFTAKNFAFCEIKSA
ncbi:Uncharacterised protein [Chlamydia trachomatis]|nr:Uncharacterised protein [Chlamydia trachomatis]